MDIYQIQVLKHWNKTKTLVILTFSIPLIVETQKKLCHSHYFFTHARSKWPCSENMVIKCKNCWPHPDHTYIILLAKRQINQTKLLLFCQFGVFKANYIVYLAYHVKKYFYNVYITFFSGYIYGHIWLDKCLYPV